MSIEDIEKIDELYEKLEDQRHFYLELIEYKNDLEDRIDKAIEYIEDHIIEDIEYENYMQCEREEKEELLNILKGMIKDD